ncbi:MAG TPA: hypothetical protein VKR58_06225 [Aquella sp.]|nr:hypothetical protein [Aquella sp.]
MNITEREQIWPKCNGAGKRLIPHELVTPIFEGTCIHKVKEPGLKYGAWNEKYKGWEIKYFTTHLTSIEPCTCNVVYLEK